MKNFKIIIAFCFSRNAADQSTPPTPQCSTCPPQSPRPDCRPHRYRELIECALGPLVLVHPQSCQHTIPGSQSCMSLPSHRPSQVTSPGTQS